jgi:hypothetical protein
MPLDFNFTATAGSQAGTLTNQAFNRMQAATLDQRVESMAKELQAMHKEVDWIKNYLDPHKARDQDSRRVLGARE